MGICKPKERELQYSRIVIIFREGKPPEVVAFETGDEDEAEEYFDRASTQWSDSFLCSVEKGPIKIEK